MSTSYTIEERTIPNSQTTWIALRARGAQWSWLTPEEAREIAEQWIEKYGYTTKQH